ncbi:hypothetical protein SAMN05216388_1010117 [Halorientalis persicus]|jgi:hypothetical protein|uniref:Uncharacterized protein n=1 Tax=Halorientalis persicus TaxID=1367881 RepID=A0A1H8NE76_9EURY|nr:hypothetical protein [Halorientalis persicus]SEO27768.1 hypothetical protein SAMN05216388_1010117 [Halorientalis persicus]
MTDLTEIGGGGEFTASDDEIERALEAASDELGEPVETIAEEVAYILDSGTGSATNEGVAGTSVGANATAASDPRLEALELYKLNNRI